MQTDDEPDSLGEKIWFVARDFFLSVLGHSLPVKEGPFLRLLYFHHVLDDQTRSFETVLQRLNKVGQFVGTDACISMIRGEIPIDGRYFHLSFDDGYRDFFLNAAPVLRRLGIPAILFVPTARLRIEEGRVTWGDLRILRSWGFEVGSHTRFHANLAGLSSSEELEAEIVGSKRDIEENLDVECKYIAWPYGRKVDIDERSLAAISRAGYLGCFGGFRGRIAPGKTDLMQIPRHHLQAEWSRTQVKWFIYGYADH